MAAEIPVCRWLRPRATKQRYAPGGSYCAIQVWQAPTVTQSGMVALPEKDPTHTDIDTIGTPLGTVVAVGPDVKRCKAGDVVLVPAHTPGCPVVFKGARLILVKDEHVVGVVEPTEVADCGEAP